MATIDEIRERLSAYSRTTHIQGYAGHEECEFLGNATDDVAFLLADLDRQSQRVAELERELAAAIERRADVERERDEARADIARIASTVLEPVTLPDGMPPLVDRIVGAIEQICRERTDAMSGEYIAIVEVERLRAIVPDERTIIVIDGAVSIAARRGDCRQLDVASVANWMAVVDAAKKEETHR